MPPPCALIGWDSKVEPVEVRSVDLGAGSEGTQEVVGAAAAAAAGEATLQKSESVEEGQEEEEPETSK